MIGSVLVLEHDRALRARLEGAARVERLSCVGAGDLEELVHRVVWPGLPHVVIVGSGPPGDLERARAVLAAKLSDDWPEVVMLPPCSTPVPDDLLRLMAIFARRLCVKRREAGTPLWRPGRVDVLSAISGLLEAEGEALPGA